jgi:hypothetical protein
MQGLNEFERAVLEKLLAGNHPVLATLRRQYEHARVMQRETTGVGFYCEFEVDGEAPVEHRDFQIGDVHAEVEGLAHGAGFVLFVRGGRLSMLEGFSYDEPWPRRIDGFSLRYSDPERKAELAKLA